MTDDSAESQARIQWVANALAELSEVSETKREEFRETGRRLANLPD